MGKRGPKPGHGGRPRIPDDEFMKTRQNFSPEEMKTIRKYWRILKRESLLKKGTTT